MIKQKKNKKGFTLVEMILSVAIICLIGGVIAGVCAAISNSFATTYSIDDSADYAMLYAKGFENSFLANTQPKVAGMQWEISNPQNDSTKFPTLMFGPKDKTKKAVFEPKFIGNKSTDYKWRIAMFFYYDTDTETVKYRIFLADAYSKTNFIYMYDDGFWVPRFKERSGKGSKTIKVEGSELSKTTLKSYGFTDEQLNQLPSKIFNETQYKTQITYG